MDRSSSWTSRNADYVPPSRVARMAIPSPRPPSSTAEAVVTARHAEYGTGGSILPVLPTASPNASKRTSWTTPRSPSDTLEDEANQSSDTFAQPPRRAEMAAARRAEPVCQRSVSDRLFASDTEQAQLAYMEQMYGTINLLNAELEYERRNRAALETAVRARPSTYSAMSDYSLYEEDVQIPFGEFDQPTGLVVSQTPVAPSYSPRKLRTMPSPPSHPPQSQHRVARPPVSPRSIVKDEELCATLGKNAELRIRSRDMERTVEKTELELELARKQIKMAERRAENREEKLRALLKEKLSWQKELKVTRAQVVEEKMRQVDLFREVEAAKRHFATELEAVEQELRASQEENAQLRAHTAEVKAHMNFQTRKMEEMARQAQDEKARFVAMIEDTRHRFREWKEGEAEALVAAHEQVVRNLKTEYELKMERHQDEKQKLREKVNDLEVSLRLLQKDRTLSPLELSLRKAAILGSKDNTGTMEAEQIEAQSRILELENLLAHSQEYQLRQESIIKLSEATISRLMQEREVTALENLSLHPFGVESQLSRSEDLSPDTQLMGYVTAPSSPLRCSSPPGTPSRRNQSSVKTNEAPSVRSPRSRSHTPRRAELEASIAKAAELDSSMTQSANTESTVPSSREQNLMDELAELRKALAEAHAKAETQSKAEARQAPPMTENTKNAEEEPSALPMVHGAAASSTSDGNAFNANVTEAISTATKPTDPPKFYGDDELERSPESNTHETTVGYEVKDILESADEKHRGESTKEVTASDLIDKVLCESPPLPETAPCQDTFLSDEEEGIDAASIETKYSAEILTEPTSDDVVKDSNIVAALPDRGDVQDKPHTEAVDSQCKAIFNHSKNKSNESGLFDSETNFAYVVDIRSLEKWSNSSPVLDHTFDDEIHVDPDEKDVVHNVGNDAKFSEDYDPNIQEITDEKEEPPAVVNDAKVSEDVVCGASLLEGFDSTSQEIKTEVDNEPSVPGEKSEEDAKDVTEEVNEPLEMPNAYQEMSPDSTKVDEIANEVLDPEAVDDGREVAMAEDPAQLISCELTELVRTSENEISDDVREDNSNIDTAVDSNDAIVSNAESAEVLVEPSQIDVPDNLAFPVGEIEDGHVDVSDVPFDILTTEPSGDFAEQPNDIEGLQTPDDGNLIGDFPSEVPNAIADNLVDLSMATAENADPETEVAIVLEEVEVLDILPNAGDPSENDTTTPPVETPEASVAKIFVTAVEFTALVLATSLQKTIDTTPLEPGMEELSPVVNTTVENSTFPTTEVIQTSAEPDICEFSGANTLTDAEITTTSVPVSSDIENTDAVPVDAPAHANIDTHELSTPVGQHASWDEKFDRERATEIPTSSFEDITETDDDVLKLVTKTFAANFVKELMKLFDSTTSNENNIETNEEVVIHIMKSFAENFVKELIEMIISKAPTNENEEADETGAGESIATTPSRDSPAASTEERTLLSENEADSIENVADSMITTVDTMALARDFMGAVECEAMSAVLHSLQNESCPDDTKANSELEVDGFESDTTRSIMGSDNVSSEEQNETCNASEASEDLISANEEQYSSVDISSTQNEEWPAGLDENASSTDQLTIFTEITQIIHDCVESVENEVIETLTQPSDDVEVVQSNDIEKPTTTGPNEFSTQDIVSSTACLFASQTIAEVLNRLTRTCGQEDNSDHSAVIESENVNINEECVSNLDILDDTLIVDEIYAKAPANEESVLMPDVDDTELLEVRNEGTAADTDNLTFMNSEVTEQATGDIETEEALFTTDSELVPSVNIDIMQDSGHATDLGNDDNDKVIALLLTQTVDQIACSEEGRATSTPLFGETQDEIPYTDSTALPVYILPVTPADDNLDAEMALSTPDCDAGKHTVGTSMDDATIDIALEEIVSAIESDNRVEPLGKEAMESSADPTSNTLLGSPTESSCLAKVSHELTEAKGTEVPTLSSEASQFLETTDSKSEDTYKHGDIEPYASSSFALQLEDDEFVVRLTLDSLIDVLASDSRSCSVSMKETTTEASDAAVSPLDEYDDSSEPTFESEMGNVVVDLGLSAGRTNASRHRDRARSVYFSSDPKEDNIDHLKQARRSVLLWKSPIGTACNKEAVESSAKRRASKRRVSRRTLADLLAFPTEITRFTSSDTTLLAYDARHEQGQICSLLDESILTINPYGRHIDMDDQDERVASRIIGKRKTLMQELHYKNLALRQIPRFNYMPMCIKFQWSDFVVATSVRPSSCNIGEGHVVKSPVEPMRLLQKKGAKLPCGSYVIVSAFIRPLEDGNENLRVQIYDAERVEEFQFDFSEDIMKKYHLETTGMESQSLEFLRHLEFRRDEDTVIIKLPEKKAEAGNNADTERLQSERTMIGGGDPRKRDPPPFRPKRPVSSPPLTSYQGNSESSS